MTTSTVVSTPTDVDQIEQIFSALEQWIKQRPGLDPADYGLGRGQTPDRKQWSAALRSYRSEIRSIGKDRARAMKALDEARGLLPAKPELLHEAFSTYSGRLTWQDGRLHYCTGQYWPTEYRKAAAAVLEHYIAFWKQAYSAEHPKDFVYYTLDDVKAANQQIGNHWFERSTMRFFNTKIESGLIAGKYFITSEQFDENSPRKFTVRRADPDGSVDTVGEFQGYSTKADARQAIKAAL